MNKSSKIYAMKIRRVLIPFIYIVKTAKPLGLPIGVMGSWAG
jgi:hypothetical protein